MNWNFNCSYMAISSLACIMGFSVRFFSASLFRFGILWEKKITSTWFLIWHLKLIKNGGVTHHFESGPPKDHFNSNFWAKQMLMLFFLLMWCINGPYNLVVEYRFFFIKLALFQIKHTHLLFSGPPKDHFNSNFWAKQMLMLFFFLIIFRNGINWLKKI
jgi:hypothetical protein